MISKYALAALMVSGIFAYPQFPTPTRQPYEPPSPTPYQPQPQYQQFGAKQASPAPAKYYSSPKSSYPSPTPQAYSVSPYASPAYPSVAPSFAPAVSPSYSPYSVKPKSGGAPASHSDGKDQVAQVLSSHSDVNYDGTFNYGFESDNGIQMKAEGYVKDPGSEDPKQVIQGSYFYYDKEGNPVQINYIADEFGFRAEGDVIPKPSKEILESLERNKAEEALHPQNSQNEV